MAAHHMSLAQRGCLVMADKLFTLTPDQQEAVIPQETIWLSASAGTGKTQVLTARVFRLLLQPGVRPENILCLTFTKAAAAEMAERISNDLARWVQSDDAKLARDLHAIGAPADPKTISRARTLFAAVLDAPGGGIAIQTIHSFCQSLLANFPLEAGIVPGFTALDDHDKSLLVDETLGAILRGDAGDDRNELLQTVRELSLLQDQETITGFLLRCAAKPNIWDDLPENLSAVILPALGLSPDDTLDTIIRFLDDGYVDRSIVQTLLVANQGWSAKTGRENTVILGQWLAADLPQRAELFDQMTGVFLTKKGKLRKVEKGQLKAEPDYDIFAAQIVDNLRIYSEKRTLLAYADLYVPALNAGRAFSRALHNAKAREGVLDFDDIIRNTANLLVHKHMADWIRYKLDRRIDHILVDESQDTNALQWLIVLALTSDFFAGEGAHNDKARTLFTVGDFKQAIYSFQGTSPFNYEVARHRFQNILDEANGEMRTPALAQSFRTAQPVLDFVDLALDNLGHEALELPERPASHKGLNNSGSVMLWQPVHRGEEDDADSADDGWFSQPDRILAEHIALQVRNWLDQGIYLEKQKRRANAGDVMILLRKRGDLARLIVNRLYAQNIRVAGIDRLRIGQPLAVRDLCAAARFTLQPEDDLNLACLLVSPLIGWSHDSLHELGYRPKGVPLWRHLRNNLARDDARIAPLFDILAMADYETPYDFFETLLSGKLEGRARLVARLGTECLDPLEEFLNISQKYQQDHHPVMQSFLHWFDAIDSEIKREIVNDDEVRVMTVHGSKGLQSPIVILADSHSDPDRSSTKGINLTVSSDDGDVPIPLWPVKKDLQAGPVETAYTEAKEQALAEHWRLAYVAMTRAEEHLCFAAIKPLANRSMPANSWYQMASNVMEGQGLEPHVDLIWGGCQVYGKAPEIARGKMEESIEEGPSTSLAALPPWALRSAPEEARPPRPLAPSSLGDDMWASSPGLNDKAQMAALRGTLLHQLFERLPDVPFEKRMAVAQSWLAKRGVGLTTEMLHEIPQTACDVINNPDWGDVFGPDSQAEVSIAANVNGVVINGTIDRLVMSDKTVRVIDFKTGRNPPANRDEIPRAHLRQMAAYGAALAQLFPDHDIQLGLLFTHNARLMWLDKAQLDDVGQGWLLP